MSRIILGREAPVYTDESIRAGLASLHEIRAAVTVHNAFRNDTQPQCRARELLLNTLMDLEAALAILPRNLRQAVFLHYECGLTERESARLLSISQAALHYRLTAAQVYLKHFLVPGGPS